MIIKQKLLTIKEDDKNLTIQKKKNLNEGLEELKQEDKNYIFKLVKDNIYTDVIGIPNRSVLPQLAVSIGESIMWLIRKSH